MGDERERERAYDEYSKQAQVESDLFERKERREHQLWEQEQ